MTREFNACGRALERYAIKVMRRRPIKAVRVQQSAPSAGAACGVSLPSVSRSPADVADCVQKLLLAQTIPGWRSNVCTEGRSWLAEAVRNHSPLQYMFKFGQWTLSLIQARRFLPFGVSRSIAMVRRLRKMLVLCAANRLYQAWQQGSAAVRPLEAEINPVVRDEVRGLGATVHVGDLSMRSDCEAGARWESRRRRPVIEVTRQCLSLNMIPPRSPQGPSPLIRDDGFVTATVIREFLKCLMIGAEKRNIVIVDGHRIRNG